MDSLENRPVFRVRLKTRIAESFPFFMRIEQGYFFAGLFCVRRTGSFCVKKQKRGCRSKGGFCMMQIKKLTLTHKKDLRVILEDFQLVLNDGDKAVIIGEEGNGKSTLLKWMYDPALTEDYIESTGERIIGKERLGYLPQELPEAEKTKTVYEYFYEKEKFWDQTPKDLAVLARKFGLTEEFFYRDQQMRELSGGEKVKAQMMRLLMEDATVLLLDEPSNDIDLATLELLEKLIREWEHIVVFISHDETLIENTANMVIHIEQIVRKTKSRYTVAKLPYRTYVEERLQNFERQEQKAQSDRREKALHDPDCRRCMPWSEIESKENQERIATMRKLIMLRRNEKMCRSLHFHFPNVYENDRCVEYIKLDEEGNRIEVLLNASDEKIKVKRDGEVLFAREFDGEILGVNGTLIRRMSRKNRN